MIRPWHAVRQAIAVRQPPAGEETVFLGLGSNIGDRLYYLSQAVRKLDSHEQIVVADISSVYETDPVGPAQRSFYNVAAAVRTELSPVALLRACHHVENRLGRIRTERWGPRTIDIDVLLYGDRELSSATLTVPHPQLTSRAFALVPLLEVAPGWTLPDGQSLAQAIAALAPIDGVSQIGQQVSLVGLPDGPPTLRGQPHRGRQARGLPSSSVRAHPRELLPGEPQRDEL